MNLKESNKNTFKKSKRMGINGEVSFYQKTLVLYQAPSKEDIYCQIASNKRNFIWNKITKG